MFKLFAVALLSFLITGCAVVSNVHTAKILETGSYSITGATDMAWSNYLFERSDTIGSQQIPLITGSLIPNIRVQGALTENFEVGAMVVPQLFGGEGNCKFRLFKGTRNHFAVVPYIGIYFVGLYTAGSHLVFTHEIDNSTIINISLYSHVIEIDSTDFILDTLPETSHIAFGTVIAPRFTFRSFFFIPSVEYGYQRPLDNATSIRDIHTIRLSAAVGVNIGDKAWENTHRR